MNNTSSNINKDLIKGIIVGIDKIGTFDKTIRFQQKRSWLFTENNSVSHSEALEMEKIIEEETGYQVKWIDHKTIKINLIHKNEKDHFKRWKIHKNRKPVKKVLQ